MQDPLVLSLRRTMTDAERRLWSVLRGRQLGGHKFRRQHPVGKYVLDFACVERKLAVEVDGGQHAGNENDDRRTEWLAAHDWQVLRFWNNDVMSNMNGVIQQILRKLNA